MLTPEMPYPFVQLLIANQWVDVADSRCIDVHNPATGEALAKVAHAGRVELDRALGTAQRGFELWRCTPACERAVIMRNAVDLAARAGMASLACSCRSKASRWPRRAVRC